ncbi:MAG: YibE/F family protein [Oscillospiraceae bacterium]|nr:YibE/F family protein [Oscillospiraceae bacterium]
MKKKGETDQKRGRLICLVLMALTVAGILLLHYDADNSYRFVNTESLTYVRAEVVSVDDENLQIDSLEPDRMVGTQLLTVRLLEGDSAGQTVSLTNYLTRSLNVYASVGQTLIVCADEPENAAPYYTVYSYSRSPSLLVILLLFVAITVAVGRTKGLWSLLGLAYTIFIILFFLVKVIFHGASPMLAAVGTVAAASFFALCLLSGMTKKTWTALAGTLLGVALAGVLFSLFAALLHISGYNIDTAESLLLIGQSTGLRLKPLLLVAVLITALGAVMDVAVSISSSLEEIHRLNPSLTSAELFKSGLNIGRDMVGTMTNTLILAYTGTALTTMLLLMSYGYGLTYLINSDYLAMELAQGVASTAGVILTVPAAVLIAGVSYGGRLSLTAPGAKSVPARRRKKK